MFRFRFGWRRTRHFDDPNKYKDVRTSSTWVTPPLRELPNAFARIAPPAEQDLMDAARLVIASFSMDSPSIKKLTAAVERYEAWADFRDMMIGTIRNGPPALPPGGKP